MVIDGGITLSGQTGGLFVHSYLGVLRILQFAVAFFTQYIASGLFLPVIARNFCFLLFEQRELVSI